jgi:hypothetical protein
VEVVDLTPVQDEELVLAGHDAHVHAGVGAERGGGSRAAQRAHEADLAGGQEVLEPFLVLVADRLGRGAREHHGRRSGGDLGDGAGLGERHAAAARRRAPSAGAHRGLDSSLQATMSIRLKR